MADDRQFRPPSTAFGGIDFTRGSREQQQQQQNQQPKQPKKQPPQPPRQHHASPAAVAVDAAAAAAAPNVRPSRRALLPAARHRRELLYLVERHAAVLVVGETGSGKTTQLPQFLLQAGWGRAGRTVCVAVPRPLAARRAAERVAEELLAAAAEADGGGDGGRDPLAGADGRALVGTYFGGGGGIGGGEWTAEAEEQEDQAQGVGSYASQALCFTTPDALLDAMAQGDPLLAACSVVVVDEAHERTLAADALLGLLRKLQQSAAAVGGAAAAAPPRPDLRVVVASATVDAAALADFFAPSAAAEAAAGSPAAKRQRTEAPTTAGLPTSREPAVLSLQGRQHPVQLHYLRQQQSGAGGPCPDYVRAAAAAAWRLHGPSAGVPGDVLVFLPTKEQAAACASMLRELAAEEAGERQGGYRYAGSSSNNNNSSPTRLLVRPLHAGLPASAVRAALEPAPRGARKVIVAAGAAAETGLTLPGVVHVIDCCFARVRAHNPASGLTALVVAPVDAATAAQRAGRAGRERAGHCFRLCTQPDFARLLPSRPVPEAQRSDLSALVLRLKALGVDDLVSFAWPAPPPPEALARALETLAALGALGEEGGEGEGGGSRSISSAPRLTVPLGARMACLLPLLPPMASRFLLAACERGDGAEEAVVVAALLLAGSGATENGGGAASSSSSLELTGGGVWAFGSSQREWERRARLFGAAEGDLVALLNAFSAWRRKGGGGARGGGAAAQQQHQRRQRAAAWASRHGLNVGALVAADRIAAALRRAVRRMGFFPVAAEGGRVASASASASAAASASYTPLPSASVPGDAEPLLRALAAGYFLNAAVFERTEYVDPLLDAVAGRRGGDGGGGVGGGPGGSGGPGGGGGGIGGSSTSTSGPREVHVYRLLRDPLGGGGGGGGPRLRIHPSSVLARASPPPPCVLFCSAAVVATGGGGGGGGGGGRGKGGGGGGSAASGAVVWADMTGVTAVDARWLADAAPHVFRRRFPDGLGARG
jgi:ATP-dependent RNA helicase DDX35